MDNNTDSLEYLKLILTLDNDADIVSKLGEYEEGFDRESYKLLHTNEYDTESLYSLFAKINGLRDQKLLLDDILSYFGTRTIVDIINNPANDFVQHMVTAIKHLKASMLIGKKQTHAQHAGGKMKIPSVGNATCSNKRRPSPKTYRAPLPPQQRSTLSDSVFEMHQLKKNLENPASKPRRKRQAPPIPAQLEPIYEEINEEAPLYDEVTPDYELSFDDLVKIYKILDLCLENDDKIELSDSELNAFELFEYLFKYFRGYKIILNKDTSTVHMLPKIIEKSDDIDEGLLQRFNNFVTLLRFNGDYDNFELTLRNHPFSKSEISELFPIYEMLDGLIESLTIYYMFSSYTLNLNSIYELFSSDRQRLESIEESYKVLPKELRSLLHQTSKKSVDFILDYNVKFPNCVDLSRLDTFIQLCVIANAKELDIATTNVTFYEYEIICYMCRNNTIPLKLLTKLMYNATDVSKDRKAYFYNLERRDIAAQNEADDDNLEVDETFVTEINKLVKPHNNDLPYNEDVDFEMYYRYCITNKVDLCDDIHTILACLQNARVVDERLYEGFSKYPCFNHSL